VAGLGTEWQYSWRQGEARLMLLLLLWLRVRLLHPSVLVMPAVFGCRQEPRVLVLWLC
jgi:hypothetical protein